MPTYVTTLSTPPVATNNLLQVVAHADDNENGGPVAYVFSPAMAEVLAQFLSYAQNYQEGDVTDEHGDYLAALDDYDALLTLAAAALAANERV